MKILVVDDELVSRKKMQKIMDGFGECYAVESGSAAITAFGKAWENRAPFDLMTLDISMPDMDGTEVLYEVRGIEKEGKVPKENRATILMVTSHSDKPTVITCIQAGCDDYIVKPFDRETIIKKLKKFRLGEYSNVDVNKDIQVSPLETGPLEKKRNIVEEILSLLKRGEINLPAFSQIGIKFTKMLKERASIQDVTDVLKQDVAISSKLISISNTAFYRGVEKNKNLEQAINRLGLGATKQYVNLICNRALFTSTNKKIAEQMEKLWEHSISCAYASQVISETLNLRLSNDAFTIGLLHDIGKLALLQVLSELGEKGVIEKDINSAELFNILDKLHGAFGAALLKKWEFPSGFTQIARYHDNLEEADSISNDLLVVHFANLLVKSMGYGQARQAGIDLVGAKSNGFLKLNSAMIADIKEQVKEHMDVLGKILA